MRGAPSRLELYKNFKCIFVCSSTPTLHGNPVPRNVVRHDGEAEAALVLIDPLEGVLLVLHVKLIEKRAGTDLDPGGSFLTEVFL